VKVITRDGVEVSNFIDCHRTGFFAIEAKDEEAGKSTDLLLRLAFGQVRHYASHATCPRRQPSWTSHREPPPPRRKPNGPPTWPADVISQIHALKGLLAAEALNVEEIIARFTGVKAEIVRRHLEILRVMGEVQENPAGRYQGAA